MPSAAVAIVMSVASVVMLSPFINLFDPGRALNSGDGRVQAWALAWVAHAITSGEPLFDANMFFPAPASLAHTEAMVALGALATPLWVVTGNAILVFNVLQVVGPAATAFAGYLLAWSWTGDRQASAVGGLAFGLSFFALLHNAHLNLTWAGGLPLSMLLLERWWQRPTWPRVAALWAVAIFTALTSWYLALMLGLLLMMQAIGLGLSVGHLNPAVRGPQLVAGVALGIAVLVPFAAPYFGRNAEVGETAIYAADIRSYVVPPDHTVVGRWLVRRGLARPLGIWGERTLFLGWSALVLAGVGLAAMAARREQRGRALMLVAVFAGAAALSFGPSSTGWALFDGLARLPGVGGFRATARFGLLVSLACAMFVAFGVARLRLMARGRAPFVTVVCAALILAERFVVDFPAGRPHAEPIPEIYSLARADGARAAIALPMYAGQANWFLEGDYLLYSTYAGFLPLGNGIGRWVPLEYLALGEATRRFPAAASAEALRFYGITHVLFHGARFGAAAGGLLAQAREGLDYVLVAERGSDALLRVRP
jgi:hypothetical protein